MLYNTLSSVNKWLNLVYNLDTRDFNQIAKTI